MKPGEPFNPRFEACDFHPEEIVARRSDLTDGQKWLYDRMVRWARLTDGERSNERAGELWRSHDNIAIELGKSAKQVGRDLAKLESEHLVGHRQRDGRKSNTYVFLFHEDFERTPTSSQTVEASDFEQTRMSSQMADEAIPPADLNGHPRPVRSDLNGPPRPSNQKEFNQQGKKIQRRESSPVLVSRATLQHHRDDAAAENPSQKAKPNPVFVRLVRDAAGLQFSRGDFAYCAELERQCVSPEVVCSGVYLGRVRKLVSDDQHRCRGEAPLPPVWSLRYFASCIAEAAKGLPAGYADHLQKWLSQQEADPLERQRRGLMRAGDVLQPEVRTRL